MKHYKLNTKINNLTIWDWPPEEFRLRDTVSRAILCLQDNRDTREKEQPMRWQRCDSWCQCLEISQILMNHKYAIYAVLTVFVTQDNMINNHCIVCKTYINFLFSHEYMNVFFNENLNSLHNSSLGENRKVQTFDLRIMPIFFTTQKYENCTVCHFRKLELPWNTRCVA